MTEADRTAFKEELAALSDANSEKGLIEAEQAGEAADLVADEAERRNPDF